MEAFAEVGLFGFGEDARGEAREVAGAGYEAEDTREVDDVGSYVEGVGEWEGHFVMVDRFCSCCSCCRR